MFIGIDIGTSGIKAIAMSADGKIAAQASAPLSVSRPHPLWSEQDPQDWRDATSAAILLLPADIRKNVQSIGIAGQMHGATLLGEDDKPLRPAILWNDGRSFEECGELERLAPDSRKITGNIAMPGFTAPKLLWIRRHEPEIFDRVRTLLVTKDYVRLCMTGDKASDMSDSAGTLWLDVGRRFWSAQMLKACGIGEGHMPALFEGSAVTGQLRADVASNWGMDRVPVVAGGGDNAAGAAGIGVIGDGDALLSLGTSGVIFVATKEFCPNPAKAVHAFCHCLPEMWHQMSVHLSAAACIDWAASQLGLEGPAKVFELAERAGPGSGPELFLPYLSGERTPHNDPHIRAAFLSLDGETNPGSLAASVLEGVAFALADGLDALRDAGTKVDELHVIGGGARSLFWGRILAATLDCRLLYLEGGEVGPALGAAKLAMIGTTGTEPAEVCSRPAVKHAIEPDPELVDLLAPKLERFRAAYLALRNL